MDNQPPKGIKEFLEAISSGNPNVSIQKIDMTKGTSANEDIEKLKKAIEEDELCKKYGKARIEALAKKINYKGELVNKK